MSDVPQKLSPTEPGEPNDADQLLPLVYDELRKLAARRLACEKPGQTLDTTALVHEVYLRLVGPADHQPKLWGGRGHFFAAAAEAMRRILVERARRKQRIRHGRNFERADIEMDQIEVDPQVSDEDILAVHEALDELDRTDPNAAKVVKLHYFLGLSFVDIAEMLGVSERTAYRNWSFARAWLYQHLADKKQ